MRSLGDELMWASSMPCLLPADETIPIGRYGASNIGRAKSVYRMGLSHRYGRRMQTISGIHYNWSMPGLNNADHFALIRNFRRHAFLLLTLFGASPALCASFVAGREHGLQTADRRHAAHAARHLAAHGPAGLPERRAGLAGSVSYNSLDGYAASLQDALTRPYAAYEKVGIMQPGRRVQPALDHAAADRERVLRHDPPQAHDPLRRAPAACAARARRRVHRGPLHGPGSVRAGRHRAPARCASWTSSCCTAG